MLPVVLWHRVIADIAAASTADVGGNAVGWAPWLLMALGLACFVAVAVFARRDRDRRFYGRSGTGAWMGRGVTLYLLGFGLATQVAQIHGSHS